MNFFNRFVNMSFLNKSVTWVLGIIIIAFIFIIINSVMKYFVFHQPINNFNYNETPINEKILKNICLDKKIYEYEFNRQGIYTTNKYEIKPADRPLTFMDKKGIYPVFLWKCEYRVTLKNSQKYEASYHPHVVPKSETQYLGIRLDPILDKDDNVVREGICPIHKEAEQEKEQIKATYHDFQDKNTWYCTNPNFGTSKE